MGSTLIRFLDKAFQADDATMEVWLAVLVKEIDKMDHVPAWLREVRDEWDLQSTAGFGFGVMPGLDRFVTDEDRRDAILNLSRRALKKLESYGEVVPRAELNALKTGGEGATFTDDVPALTLLRPARYFIKLLEGKLTPSEDDARFEPDAGE